MEKRYQVFISSTYADLKDERAKVIQTIMELDCIPAGMEIFPAIDQEQFDFIKKVIDDCDYYILIIGGRYGSITKDGISYTEQEYDYAISKGIKVLAFLPKNPDDIPIGKSEKDIELREKLEKFKEKVSQNKLIKFWDTAEELPALVISSLTKTIKTYPAVGWVRGNTLNSELYKQLSELQQENAELKTQISQTKKDTTLEYDLKDMKMLIKISGTLTCYTMDIAGKKQIDWELETTFLEIFKKLSPRLLSSEYDNSVKILIGKIAYSIKLQKEYSGGGTIIINDDIFQTIKIHFMKWKLIKFGYNSWFLTDKGQELMTDLRTTKNAHKDNL